MPSAATERVLDALRARGRRVRASGGGWMAQCPNHTPDEDESLSVGNGRNGGCVVHCFRGCRPEAIVRTLGLEMRDLCGDNGTPHKWTKDDADRALANRGLRPGTIAYFQIIPDLDKQAWSFPLGKNGKTKYKTFPSGDNRPKYWTEKGAKVVVYHLRPCVGRPVAYLVEGEPDVWTMHQAGVAAFTLTGGAATPPTPALATQIARAEIGTIVILYDNDAAGRNGALKVAAALRTAIAETGSRTRIELRQLRPSVGPGGDVTTLYGALGRDDAAFREALQALPSGPVEPEPNASRPEAPGRTIAQAPASPAPTPVVVCFKDITAQRVRWLWERRIPFGKVTLVVGDMELGKTTVLVDVAARVTRGWAFPDGALSEARNVLFLTMEDGLADTIRGRLEAAEAELSRVHTITMMQQPEGNRDLMLPTDLGQLEMVIRDHAVGLVVLDPIKAYVRGDVNEWRDLDVRRILGPVARLAERTDAAVVGIMHLNKSAGQPVQYRVSGTVAWPAAARAVHLVSRDPEDQPDGDRRLLAVLKNNLARHSATLAYRIISTDGTADGPSRIEWLGESTITAWQALAVPEDAESRSALEEAVDFLRDTLPRPAKDVLRQARANGIADKTLARARTRLGVRSTPAGFGGPRLLTLPSVLAKTPSVGQSPDMANTAKTEGGMANIVAAATGTPPAPATSAASPSPALAPKPPDPEPVTGYELQRRAGRAASAAGPTPRCPQGHAMDPHRGGGICSLCDPQRYLDSLAAELGQAPAPIGTAPPPRRPPERVTVTRLTGGVYEVSDGSALHRVSADAADCNCADFLQFRRRPCQHIEAVREWCMSREWRRADPDAAAGDAVREGA